MYSRSLTQSAITSSILGGSAKSGLMAQSHNARRRTKLDLALVKKKDWHGRGLPTSMAKPKCSSRMMVVVRVSSTCYGSEIPLCCDWGGAPTERCHSNPNYLPDIRAPSLLASSRAVIRRCQRLSIVPSEHHGPELLPSTRGWSRGSDRDTWRGTELSADIGPNRGRCSCQHGLEPEQAPPFRRYREQLRDETSRRKLRMAMTRPHIASTRNHTSEGQATSDLERSGLPHHGSAPSRRVPFSPMKR
jgi:hypothetical protein